MRFNIFAIGGAVLIVFGLVGNASVVYTEFNEVQRELFLLFCGMTLVGLVIYAVVELLRNHTTELKLERLDKSEDRVKTLESTLKGQKDSLAQFEEIRTKVASCLNDMLSIIDHAKTDAEHLESATAWEKHLTKYGEDFEKAIKRTKAELYGKDPEEENL